jgi:hypothetical protein
LTSIAEAVWVNRPYQSVGDFDITPQWRAHYVNDSITPRILPDGSARSISLRFAVNREEEISFVMKEPRKLFLIPREFITSIDAGT